MEKNKNIQENIILTLLWIAPILFLVTLLIVGPRRVEHTPSTARVVEETFYAADPFESIHIEARAAIVQDLNTGEILYEKNSGLALPLASLTKIMTTLVTQATATDVSNVFISSNTMRPLDGEQLYIGETFSLKRLIDYTLVTSSNDGAAAIAYAVQNMHGNNSFIDKMNALASEIGMTSTHFLNETGLDEDKNRAGAYGSARDVAELVKYTLENYPSIFEATKETSIATYSRNGFIHAGANTNIIANTLPNLIASKTGFTDIAGGNLAVVIDPALNRPVVIVVLSSSYDGRFSDVTALAGGVSKYFSLQE